MASAIACGGDGDVPGSVPRFLNQDPAVRYVGLQACRRCHVEIAASYAHTGMGRSFYPMSPRVAVEDFTRDNQI